MKYHYRETEGWKTRDKEQTIETNTHSRREKEKEEERLIKAQRGRLNEAPLASKND